MTEVSGNFCFDLRFGTGIEGRHVDPWEVNSALVLKVVLQVPQKIHLLEGSAQASGIGQQTLVGRSVAKDEDVQAHQTHHLCRAHDVVVIALAVVRGFVQVPLHGTQKQVDVLLFNVVGLVGLGKSMQDGVAAHAVFQCPVGVLLEPGKHGRLLRPVQRVHNFICVAHETIDVVDGFAKGWRQEADPQGETGAVGLGRAFGTFRGHVVV